MLHVNLSDLFDLNRIKMGATIMLLTSAGYVLSRISDVGL